MGRPGQVVWWSWLAVAALGVAALFWSALGRARVAFDTDARILHRVLSQTLAQQEALLSAVDSLERQGVDAGTLGEFVGTLLGPYPQVVAVQRCADGSCRTLGKGAFTPPALSGVAGARPVVLWPAASGSVYVLAQRNVRLWVDAARLLPPDARPAALAFTVFRPQGGPVLVQSGGAGTGGAHLGVRKVLGTASQPFPIRIDRNLPPESWPWAAALAWLGVSGVLAAGMARLWAGRAAAQRAVMDERARAQGVVQGASDGVVALDGAHRVTLANPAARAVLGHALPPGVDVREVAVFRSTLAQAPFDAARFWNSPQATALPEGLSLRRGADAVLVEGSVAPLRDASGDVQGRVLILREVGPLQRRMLEQLEAHERRVREHEAALAHVSRLSTLGEMSAGLAHELNQPLTAIVSYGQAAARLLDDPEPDLPQARRAVAAGVAQARRAAEIIAHLRGLVRRAPMQERMVDLLQAVQNVVTLCHTDFALAQAELRVVAPPTPPLVMGDPVHLEQIILNLLRNALDAVRDAPLRVVRVEVAASPGSGSRPTPPGWTLCVYDSGPGLSADALGRLFTPFSSTKADGLGLGLTLSQTLAQGMGGQLGGANAAGGGAVFTLTLPGVDTPRPAGVTHA